MPKRVLIDGVFDLFHPGHIKLLKEIKDMDNYYLIVGVHNDEDVISYKRKPILNMHDRAYVIESCKYVDEVIINSPLYITKKFLEKNKIDLVFHAHSIEENDKYRLMYDIPQKMNIFRRIDYHNGISTSEIIERCKNNQ